MPLMKSKSPKAFEHNFKAEMSAGKPKDQSLAIAYSVKRKAKKMAKGGMVAESASNEARPMPDQAAASSKMVSHNSGKRPNPQDGWTDQPTVAQARKPSRTALSQPKMVESSVIKARPLGMLKDDEADIMGKMSPDGYGKQPKADYDEEGADRQGPQVPDMQREHSNGRKPYFEGGVVSQKASEEDMVERPASLEMDNDQMRPSEEEIMADHFAEGGEIGDTTKEGLVILKKGHPPETDEAKARTQAMRRASIERNIKPKMKGLAEGGMAEMDEDHHDSLAAAIMAKRKMIADGGMVDIDENAEEQPNGYYHQNEDAALKENYDSDMDDVSQPQDSNLKGDMREMDESDPHDMVGSIRKRMKSRKQF